MSMTAFPRGRRAIEDPIAFEVFRNAISGLADEMAITLMRTAHSQLIAETVDFSTALCDDNGRVIAQANCVPVHMGAIPDTMDAVLRKFGTDIRDGDIYIVNDPDEGGMHLQDIFLIKPIFVAGDLTAFAVCVGHQADMGGRVPGSNAVDSSEIFEEGLQLPLMRLYDAGAKNETIFAILARNVRLPELVLGDLEAQINSCFTAEEGMRLLVGEYGRRRFGELCDELLDYSERLLRRALNELPDGTYSFTDYLDDDGAGTDDIVISVRIEISGSNICLDFRESASQVPSALNCTASFTKSAAYAALQAAIASELPSNSGFYRPVSFRLPEASVLNGRRPAARAARGIVGYRIVDAVWGALASIVPHTIPAAGDGGPSIVAIGTTARDAAATIVLDHLTSAWGGRPDRDGLDGVSAMAGNLANTPVEELERTGVVHVEQYAFVQDSGGPGRWRGGLGTMRDLRLLEPSATLQTRIDRHRHRPYGLAGGLPGAPSASILTRANDTRVLPTKVTTTIRLGDVHRHVTAGGGGHGDPLDRDSQLVAEDVANEKVSREAAFRDYCVVLDRHGGVNAEATTQLRRKSRLDREEDKRDGTGDA